MSTLDIIFCTQYPVYMMQNQLAPIRKRESAVIQVYRSLREAVLERRLAAGQRLIETELAELLGVSRTPVREALYRLEAEGLVESLPAGGVAVRDLESEFIEIYELRQRLEGYAANLAAQRMTSKELGALEEAYGQALAEIDNPSLERRAELNNTFHRLLTTASHSPRLIRMINDYRDYFLSQQVLQFYDRATALRHHEQHSAIVEALRQHDGDAAEDLVRQHFQSALEIVQASLYGARASRSTVTDENSE